jgi:deazaflavin-dependent oxidoreductase (nitroreductase family)
MTSSEPQYLYLTTTGWKSGRPHEIEIWFTSLEGSFYVLTEHGERAHWVQNLRRTPEVRVRVGDQTYRATARLLDESADPALGQRVRDRSQEKYGWGGGAIVELELLADLPAD